MDQSRPVQTMNKTFTSILKYFGATIFMMLCSIALIVMMTLLLPVYVINEARQQNANRNWMN